VNPGEAVATSSRADSYDVNENSDVYYAGKYWNDLDAVNRRINRRISGDPSMRWFQHFARTADRVFGRALILNCGNGWVERDLVAHGLIEEAVGIDFSQTLLDQAAATALEQGLPLTYRQANINTVVLTEGEYDLVVNHAAAHHIAAIDRVFRQICRALPEDGWFVSFDYVGPHRNQYRLDAWEEAWRVNCELPPFLRQDLAYPSVTAMVQIDPTEAVHSELIMDTFRRYFVVQEYAPLGGAVAYPVMTHNARLFAAPADAQREQWIERILTADDRFLDQHPDSTLFAYFAGTPNKSVLHDTARLAAWEAEEEEREARAATSGGEYYQRGPLAEALIERDREHLEAEGLRAQLALARAEVEALRSSPLYSGVRRILDSRLVRRVRATPLVRDLEQRARH